MHVLHGVVCHVWLYVWDAHYVCVHMVEEKALSVVGCDNRSSVCTKRKNEELRVD